MNDRNLYVCSEKSIDSIVAYLAIHDFADWVTAACKEGTGNELLRRFHGSVQQASGFVEPYIHQDGHVPTRSHELKQFAEQVVLGIPIDPAIRHPVETEVANALDRVIGYQFVLAIHGFFAGGGLTRDLHYSDNEVVYGRGLVEAVGAFKSHSEFPRIVLTQRLINWVLEHCRQSYPWRNRALERGLLVDQADENADVWFVNYLVHADEGYGDAELLRTDWLRSHADMIRQLPVGTSDQARRVGWLAGYHNWFCGLYVGLNASLFINDLPKEVKISFTPPYRLSEWLKSPWEEGLGQ